jgi:DnaJ family protein A protein 2
MNYYNILGVDITATQEEIKKQYKKKAIILHPDKGGCEEKFKELIEAYSILSDEKKRHEYDMFGKDGSSPNNMFRNDPFFNLFFGQQNDTNFTHQNISHKNIKKDNNIEITLELNLEEIYAGMIKSFSFHRNENCNKCINNSIKKCDICNGTGFVIQMQSIGPFVQRIRNTCNNCLGKGKKITKNNACIICHGNNTILMKKNMQIKIQKGISINNKIVIQNEGHQDIENGNGNLLISIKEIQHKVFIRDKNNLLLKMDITLYDILLKIKIEIKHLDNRKLYIEANSDEIRCIINEGMYCLIENQEKIENYNKGNLYIIFNIIYPNKDIPKNIKINKNNNIISINDNNDVNIEVHELLSMLLDHTKINKSEHNQHLKNIPVITTNKLSKNIINKIKQKILNIENNSIDLEDDSCKIQ